MLSSGNKGKQGAWGGAVGLTSNTHSAPDGSRFRLALFSNGHVTQPWPTDQRRVSRPFWERTGHLRVVRLSLYVVRSKDDTQVAGGALGPPYPQCTCYGRSCISSHSKQAVSPPARGILRDPEAFSDGRVGTNSWTQGSRP